MGSVLIRGGDELSSPKLTGIPQFRSSKRAGVADTVLEQLAHFGMDLSTIAGVVYDTTASNSGRKSGERWRLEKGVGHAFLGLECRNMSKMCMRRLYLGTPKVRLSRSIRN